MNKQLHMIALMLCLSINVLKNNKNMSDQQISIYRAQIRVGLREIRM